MTQKDFEKIQNMLSGVTNPILDSLNKTNNIVTTLNLNFSGLEQTIHGPQGDNGMYKELKDVKKKLDELEKFKIRFVSKVVGGVIVAQFFLVFLGWIITKLFKM